MNYRVNPRLERVSLPPIAEAAGWVADAGSPREQPLLDVAQAVPSYPPAAELAEHIARAATQRESALYTPVPGLPALREALAAHMQEEYGGSIRSEQVVITAGCNQAFCAVMTALAAPGDEVVLPLPYYFNHQMWLELQGIRPVLLPFAPGRQGVPDPQAAAAAINARTRAIVLVTPNNPTGAVYPPEVIAEFYELARRHGIALVLDETYKDFRPATAPPHGLFQDPHWAETCIQLYSFSKSYSLSGYRVGSVIGGRAVLDGVEKILDCIAICAPRIAQSAALFGLRHLAAWRREKAALLHDRMAAFGRLFGGGGYDLVRERGRNDGLRYELVTQGAYFAYVRHPFDDEPAATVARRLATRWGVLCLPGSMFGPDQERYLRFAFANLATEQLPELARRLVLSQP